MSRAENATTAFSPVRSWYPGRESEGRCMRLDTSPGESNGVTAGVYLSLRFYV